MFERNRNATTFVFQKKGDVAQLARVPDWQSGGRRFEPDLLHFEVTSYEVTFFML